MNLYTNGVNNNNSKIILPWSCSVWKCKNSYAKSKNIHAEASGH